MRPLMMSFDANDDPANDEVWWSDEARKLL